MPPVFPRSTRFEERAWRVPERSRSGGLEAGLDSHAPKTVVIRETPQDPETTLNRNLIQEVHDKLREVLGKDGPTLTATAPETKKEDCQCTCST
jgi:hypothetical protein